MTDEAACGNRRELSEKGKMSASFVNPSQHLACSPTPAPELRNHADFSEASSKDKLISYNRFLDDELNLKCLSDGVTTRQILADEFLSTIGRLLF